MRETNRVGTLQPTILIAYTADIEPLLDSRDPAALAPFELDAATLADLAWRGRMLARASVPTQDLAEAAIVAEYASILVRSFARGAGADALNLVLWALGGAADAGGRHQPARAADRLIRSMPAPAKAIAVAMWNDRTGDSHPT